MIDFPGSPAIGEAFTAGSATWKWDGIKWMPAWSASPGLSVNDRAIFVSGSRTIAASEAGNVYVSGLTAAASIVLPPSPLPGDRVFVKDTDGSAGAHPITVIGAGGATIDDQPSFQLNQAYAQARFSWCGAEWSVG